MAVAPDDRPRGDGQRAGGGRPPDGLLSSRLALAVFAVAVAATAVIIVRGVGAYHWFLRDDWSFLIVADETSFADLFEPHNAHWSFVPRLSYLVMWKLVGVTSYGPYQGLVVLGHLTVAVMLRVVMRRAGVHPWLATAAAGALLLFGPGSQNIVWAFQIAWVTALSCGLAAVALADHDGPLGRRDALAVLAGLVALMSAGIGVPLVAALGLSILLRRGVVAALVVTGPLAVIYGVWAVLADPQSESAFGRPSAGTLASWVAHGVVGTFRELGQLPVLAVAMAGVTVVGTALAWAPWRAEGSWAARLRPPARLCAPLALLAGSLAFSAMTGYGRHHLGPEGSTSSRYVYVLAALTLPALAVAADAIGRLRRPLVVPLALLFVVPIPWSVDHFGVDVFGERYMADRQRILTTAVRVPFARDVPRDVRPVPDPYDGDLTIGFLLDAADAGKLEPSTHELSGADLDEMRIRLGVAQRRTDEIVLGGCARHSEPVLLEPEEGSSIIIGSPVGVTAADAEGRPSSRQVDFHPRSGRRLTAELPDLRILVGPARGQATFAYCPG